MKSGIINYLKQGTVLAALMAGVVLFLPAALMAAEVHLELQGLTGPEKKNVRAALTLPSGIERDGQINHRWLNRFVETIPERVQDALQPFGYYQARAVTAVEERQDGSVLLRVSVEQGAPVLLEEVMVSYVGVGSERPELLSQVSAFPLKQGGQLNHQLYEEAKVALRVKSVDLGYLRSHFVTNLIEVDPGQLTARVEIEIDTGPLFYFGEVQIEGAETYPDEFLERYLAFSPGEVFSYEKLNRTRVNYLKANRFDEILLVPEIEVAENNAVPVKVRLTAGAARRLRPGVGFGTNTGARLSLNYQELNIARKAHRFEADLMLAQKVRSLETSYTIPLAGHKENSWVFSGGLQYEDINTYETDIAYLETERIFGWGDDAVGSAFLRFHYEDFSISDQEDVAHLFMPGVRFHLRHYDDPVNPGRGYQYRLELRGSHDDALSDTSMVQFGAAGTLMTRLWEDGTLHLRSEFGVIAHDEPLSEIPASLRYYVGGDNSVRGFAYKSRGPRDQFNKVTGGDGLLTGSLELEHAFSERYGGALFFDIGSAFMAFHKMTFISGAGFGARIYTPVGPIKFDLARQLSEDDPSWRFHLSVGFDI